MRGRLFLAGVIVTLMAASPVWAHHSFAAEFDASKPVKVRGVVSRVEWINPHTWIHVDVKKPDGSIESWMFEGGTPNALFRQGVTKASLPIGTEVVVEGYEARAGGHRANGRDIQLPDGKKLFLSGSGEPGAAPSAAPTAK